MATETPTTRLEERPVITGMGLVCPWGMGPADAVLTIAATTAPPQRDDDGAWRIPDAVLAPDAKRVADLGGDRACLLAVPAFRHGLEQAGCDLAAEDPTRVGIVLGSAFAALADMLRFATEVKEQTPRFVSPLHFPQTVGNYAAGALSRVFKINGPNLTFGNGPRAGLEAVAEAAQLIRADWADLILAGGTDAVSANLLPAVAGAEEPRDDVPFASQPAEGACFFVIESESRAAKRGATVLARFVSGPDHPDRAVLCGDFGGDARENQEELDAISRGASVVADAPTLLSSRHLLGNAFAASNAAQLALAVTALRQGPLPRWSVERSADKVRQADAEPVATDAGLSLAASRANRAGKRVTIFVQAE